MTLDLSWWGHLAGLLAVEAALVIAPAGLMAWWLRSPQMQRALWQTALLGVAMLWVAELAGARGQFAKLLPGEHPGRTLSIRVLDAPGSEPVTEPFPLERTASAPVVTAPPRPVWWPGWVWLAGLTLLAGRLALGRAGLAWCAFKTRSGWESASSRERGLSRPSSDSIATEPTGTEAVIEPLRRRLGLRRVRVLVWPRLRGPVAFGVLRPTVALPADFSVRFSPAQREAMFAHELAHLAARDPLWLALADLVCALAWWHPAVWWARRQLRAACERAADEAAALVPDGRAALAESLVTFGRELAAPRWARGLGVAGDGLKSQLARRVKVLLHTSGEWRAVRPARLWLMRFTGAAMTATLVALPWPVAGGPSLPMLLAAARGEEVAPKVKGMKTTLPRVEEHGELGNQKLQVLDFMMPLTVSSYSNSEAGRLPELTQGSPLINGISYELVPNQVSYGFLPLDPLKNRAVQSTVSDNLTIKTPRPQSSEVYVALRDLLVKPVTTRAASSKTNTTDPRQIELSVQFVEITEGGSDDLGLDWLFGQSPTNNPALQSGPATNLLAGAHALHGQNLRVDLLRTEGQSVTLTATQFAALQTRFKERSRVDYLSAPKVITQAGRQARIEVSEAKTVVTGADAAKPSATNRAGIHYQTEQISIGPAVDLIAASEADGWRLLILASVTEFLGYDQPQQGQVIKTVQPGGKVMQRLVAVPLPRLRVRNVQANALAKDGETVALRGPWVDEVIQFKDKVPVLGDIPLLGRMFRSEGKSTLRKRLYVFVTPTELTATGARKK